MGWMLACTMVFPPVRALLPAILCLAAAAPLGAQERGPLTVYAAGSLARPFRALLAVYARRHPGLEVAQENSGSLEAARKLTELDRVPDVLAVADRQVIAGLLVPAHARWYATFASSAMVLAYTPASTGAREIGPANWWRVLLQPGVRTAHSDPALDPAGYRALMALQLAERHYRMPGLARRLARAVRPGDVRPKSADLIALLQTGEIDYAWEYEAVARQHGLRWVRLPPEIDLGDPARAAGYARAAVRLPGPRRRGADSLTVRGEPIAYALTIPLRAPHPERAHDFVRFVFSAEGRRVLEAHGFRVPERPTVVGPAPASLSSTSSRRFDRIRDLQDRRLVNR